MPRPVPSQVVEFIDVVFPAAKTAPEMTVGPEHAPHLAGIADLVGSIPDELLQISGADYTDLVMGVAGLRHIVSTWENRGPGTSPSQRLRGAHPVVLVRRALAKCPDQSPSSTTTELAFIADVDLRNSIRSDISEANSALHSREWKTATVMAGSTTEALLLWGLENKKTPADLVNAISALVSAGTIRRPSDANPETWHLHEYIEVALQLGLIKNDTAKQARLAKDFRNLIHPGRAARLGQKCDRATALSALAAVEHVARDLI